MKWNINEISKENSEIFNCCDIVMNNLKIFLEIFSFNVLKFVHSFKFERHKIIIVIEYVNIKK